MLPLDKYLFHLSIIKGVVRVRIIDGADFWNGHSFEMSGQDYLAFRDFLLNVKQWPRLEDCKTLSTSSFSVRPGFPKKDVILQLVGKNEPFPISRSLYKRLVWGKGFVEMSGCVDRLILARVGRDHEIAGATTRTAIGCHRHLYRFSYIGGGDDTEIDDWFLTKNKCLEEGIKRVDWAHGHGIRIRRYYLKIRRLDSLVYDTLKEFCRALDAWDGSLPRPTFSYTRIKLCLQRIDYIMQLALGESVIRVATACAQAVVLACYHEAEPELEQLFRLGDDVDYRDRVPPPKPGPPERKPNPIVFAARYLVHLADSNVTMTPEEIGTKIRDLYEHAYEEDLGPDLPALCRLLGGVLQIIRSGRIDECDDWGAVWDADRPLKTLSGGAD